VKTAEVILTYIGTVFIALGFVGGSSLVNGIKDLQALVLMLLAWPLRPYINDMFSKGDFLKIVKVKNPLFIIYALLFLIIMCPITIGFYILYFVFTPLELIHIGVNKVYLISQKEYRPTYGSLTKMILIFHKTPKKITEEKVIKEIQRREIPVLPIMGIILITIALIVHFA
jgi:hypothetical protein